jgi:VIT1/CCC1 family predicted Fe2+/Mn2+ transporter
MTKPNDPSIDSVVATAEIAKSAMSSRLNWLRAAILGANDGIMSTSGMVLGVAAAPGATSASILIAGTAAIVAGSFSMAGGEYTSVSAQRDSEKSAIETEREELKANPEGELRELAWFYEQKGISPMLAIKIAEELSAKDSLRAHADAELGIDIDQHANPMQAATSSFIAFAAGGLLPMLAVATFGVYRVQATAVAVVFALIVTGFVGAKIGGSKPGRPIFRNLIVSLMTMGITYLIGHLVGSSIA